MLATMDPIRYAVLEDSIRVAERPTLTRTEARRRLTRLRLAAGRVAAADLLSVNPKTEKNHVPTWLLHLAPATLSGADVCPFRTAGCEAACLNTAGRGAMSTVQAGRLLRTSQLMADPEAFVAMLAFEIEAKARRHGRVLIRLNGTADIRWERVAPWLFDIPGVEFYDYTKWPHRPGVPSNYKLCYSASERDSDERLLGMLHKFGHVAVCVDTPAPRGGAAKLPLPSTWLGQRAWDGDETDDWRDRPGFTLLRVKGDGVGDTSGFVRPTLCN